MNKTGWSVGINHCSWAGVTCSASYEVTEVHVENNQLSGPVPSDFNSLDSLKALYLSDNALVGMLPNNLCARSLETSLHIYADVDNCPNGFDSSTGEYHSGCCDNILIDVDIYLNEFAAAVLGDANCANLGGTESDVCDYMTNKANHDIFASGYPEDFPGVWDWLKVRIFIMKPI